VRWQREGWLVSCEMPAGKNVNTEAEDKVDYEDITPYTWQYHHTGEGVTPKKLLLSCLMTKDPF
jgi:hypothetical protein